MKSFLFTSAILIANIKSQEYVAQVPQFIQDVYSVLQEPCNTAADCDNLYQIPANSSAFWLCIKKTITSDNKTTTINTCQFNGCDIGEPLDCDINHNEICKRIHKCDNATGQFYDESYDFYSTICMKDSLCDAKQMRVEGEWTDNSMCYTGVNEQTYYSPEETIICGETCIDKSYNCKESDTASSDCIKDKTCCDKDNWDESGCLELLFTEYLIYTVIALAVLLLCCCGCCCCIYKARKKSETYDEMDNQTNHYNVYI